MDFHETDRENMLQKWDDYSQYMEKSKYVPITTNQIGFQIAISLGYNMNPWE